MTSPLPPPSSTLSAVASAVPAPPSGAAVTTVVTTVTPTPDVPATFGPLELGSWAQWASAFLTSGSLALGFYILLRDRRKAERDQAVQFFCKSHEVHSRGLPAWHREPVQLLVTLHNTSNQTISDPRVYISGITGNRDEPKLPGEGLKVIAMSGFEAEQIILGSLGNELTDFEGISPFIEGDEKETPVVEILPGQRGIVRWPRPEPELPYSVSVIFLDARGLMWVLDTKKHRLQRYKPPGSLKNLAKRASSRIYGRRKSLNAMRNAQRRLAREAQADRDAFRNETQSRRNPK